MRGIGGPLLCIGDLLSDVGEPDDDIAVPGLGHHLRRGDRSPLSPAPSSPSSSSSRLNFDLDFQPTDLNKLFQENYNQLTRALDGTDHSWTSLTLKLCSALDTADKLIKSTNLNTITLSEKVTNLEGMINRRDDAVKQVRSIHSSLIQKGAAPTSTLAGRLPE
ncbi:hypothetical protein V2J09_000783 [Rumex salicifolius]